MTTSNERINNMFANSSTWRSKEEELKGRAAIHASQVGLGRLKVRAQGFLLAMELRHVTLSLWDSLNVYSIVKEMFRSESRNRFILFIWSHVSNAFQEFTPRISIQNTLFSPKNKTKTTPSFAGIVPQVNRYSAANARAFAGSTVSQEDLEKEREASQKRKAAEANELAALLQEFVQKHIHRIVTHKNTRASGRWKLQRHLGEKQRHQLEVSWLVL